MNCRFDKQPLKHEYIDLGFSPPANSFLNKAELNQGEIYYPQKLYVSERSFLVQIDEYKKADEIFCEDYAYFSSFSQSWVAHAKKYVDMISDRLKLNAEHQVMEIASNDGYLLKHFVEKGVPSLGIEPSANVAAAAKEVGVESIIDFFGESLATKLATSGKCADLLIGNNVLAHVPDINDFVKGLKIALKLDGVITMEFPHLMVLVEECQFDTIYHEHFSYLSCYTVQMIFKAHGLELFDVEQISTTGGSLRIYAKHAESNAHTISPRVDELLVVEKNAGMQTLEYYSGFQKRVNHIKYALLDFLLKNKLANKKVAAYGAAAKGNTLLNYCGIKQDMIDYIVDASPHKQGKYMPGSHIPIVNESVLKNEKPDFILILPWNIKDEIIKQLAYAREWGAQFVIAIPELEIS